MLMQNSQLLYNMVFGK